MARDPDGPGPGPSRPAALLAVGAVIPSLQGLLRAVPRPGPDRHVAGHARPIAGQSDALRPVLRSASPAPRRRGDRDQRPVRRRPRLDGIAEHTSSAEFRRLLQRFYGIASHAIEHNDGIVDKFLGDGVMALFIPVITGERHASRAVMAGRMMLDDAERSDLAASGVRIGVGLHTGTAFVGVLGSDDNLDFSALGDTVNVAARLGSIAGPGELVVSRMAWEAAGLDVEATNRRQIEVAGREGPLEVIIDGPTVVTTTAA